MKNTFNRVERRSKKMTESEIKGNKPDYTGKLDVAAWVNKDKHGKTYLSVKVGSYVNLFKNESKDQLE